ncbi:TIGR02206 family membrane protein [Aeromicrobium sp. Leaf350]|uniref:YwaF family protein n=1 Tax=Aeromicrobium sp. Leaf350 TaxID=2876565 RepID=UPI001E57305E|nr:TIGR02206 family membrane protein [Aeromicrobium sp. Leaf350]
MIAADDFEAYDTSHLAVLAIFAIGIVAVVLAGRARRGTPAAAAASRAGAVAVAAVTIPLQVLQFTPDEWNLNTSLPLQLCDLAWMVAVHALWTGNRTTATITWLWGLTLTMQGMLTPDLSSPFPEPRFLMFWAMHVLIIWAGFWLVPGLGIGPTWRTYRRAVAATLVWLVGVYAFNVAAGTNYGYVNRKPQRASALDLLPEWPWYVAVEIVVLTVVWALLVLPWALRHPRSGEPETSPAPGR